MTRHQKQKKALSEGWEELRKPMSFTLIEESGPATDTCAVCNDIIASIIRCMDCGPTAYFCQQCFEKQHAVVILHQPEQWNCKVMKNNFFQHFLHIQRTASHVCAFQ